MDEEDLAQQEKSKIEGEEAFEENDDASENGDMQGAAAKAPVGLEESEDEEAEEEEENLEKAEERLESSLTENQRTMLKSKVLLPLKRHLLSIEGDQSDDRKTRIRSDVAIAIIKLIRIFPIQSFN